MSSFREMYQVRKIETVGELCQNWPLFEEGLQRLEPDEPDRRVSAYFRQLATVLTWDSSKRGIWVLSDSGEDCAFLVLTVIPNVYLEEFPWVFLTYTRKGIPNTIDVLVGYALEWSRNIGYKKAYFRNTSFGPTVAERYYRRFGAKLNAVEFVTDL